MKVLAIPDRHMPWHHKKACAWAVAVAKTYQPDVIVGLGDELDCYSLSKYPRSHNLYTPAEEYRRGMLAYVAHWEGLRKAAPDARLYEVSSNHVDRLHKRVLDRLPEVEHLLDEDKVFGVDGVRRVRGYLRLDGVQYEHGFRARAVDHARHNQMSTVHGHTHAASLTWLKNGRGSYFNLEVGWLADEKSPVFNYVQAAVRPHTLAVGLITNGQPQLLRYPGK